MNGRSTLLALILALGASISPARAQSASGAWELEAHAGGLWSSSPTAGAAGTLPAATPFTTTFGFPSRHESSWTFGDGASLLNAVNITLRAVNGQITPLDSTLGAAAATRGNGGSAGFRVARHFAGRYAAEFALDYASTPLEFTAKAVDGIDATRSSFITAWNALIATGPFATPKVTATNDLRRSGGHQLLTTGVLTVDLVTRGRLIPYVEGGGGVVSNGGDAPTATVKGTYMFSAPSTLSTNFGVAFPVNETDKVTIGVAPRDHEMVGVFGGGVRYAASSRWGIRADVRVHVGGGKVDTMLDASPNVATGTPAGAISSITNPSIQFTDNPSAGLQSTLSGPAITGLRTFTGSGTAIRTNVAAGIYWRF